jgi:hypothetical protein
MIIGFVIGIKCIGGLIGCIIGGLIGGAIGFGLNYLLTVNKDDTKNYPE